MPIYGREVSYSDVGQQNSKRNKSTISGDWMVKCYSAHSCKLLPHAYSKLVGLFDEFWKR